MVAAGVIHRGSAGPNAQIGAPADLRQVNLPAPELVPLNVAPRLDRLRAGSGAGSGCEGYRGCCVVIGTWVSRARLLMRLLLRIGKKKNDRLFAEAGNRGTFNPRGGSLAPIWNTRLRGGIGRDESSAEATGAYLSACPSSPSTLPGNRRSHRADLTRACPECVGESSFQILEHPGDGGVVEGPRARVEPLLNERDASVLGRHRLRRHELLLLRLHLLQEMDLRG